MAVTREQVVQWLTQSEVSFFPNCKGDVIGDFDEVVELIDLARADLEATIAEQAKEIERLKAAADPDPEALHIAYLHGQGDARSLKALIKDQQAEITEQAAHIERLREALADFLDDSKEVLANYKERYGENYRQHRIESQSEIVFNAEEALSIPSSADALREHDAKLVERISDGCELSTKLYLRAIAGKIREGEF